MKSITILALILAAVGVCYGAPTAAKWYQSRWCPQVHCNADGTKLRLYGATPDSYAEITVKYHGNMTPQQAVKILQPYCKGQLK